MQIKTFDDENKENYSGGAKNKAAKQKKFEGTVYKAGGL